MSRAPDLVEFLERLAETLSFARILEEHADLRPADLRRLLREAASHLAQGTSAQEPRAASAAVVKPLPALAGGVAAETSPATSAAAPRAAVEAPASSSPGKPGLTALPLPEDDRDEDEESDEDSGLLTLDPQDMPAPSGGETVATILADVFVDGASKGNPGPSSVGFVIAEPGGIEFVAQGQYIGKGTNNEAEYRALLRALEAAQKYGFRRLRIHSDSQLLIRQLQGTYKVNHPQLRLLFEKAKERLAGFEYFELRHIPRELNARADALANEAIKSVMKKQKVAAKPRRKPAADD